MDFNALLAAVKSRDTSREGIATARSYLASIGPCLGDEACTAKFFQPHGYDAWAKALQDAESRLVYRNADMLPEAGSFTSVSGRKNCLATFDFILTSTRKDRDGDVLEAGGAKIDEAMPLLWQHIPLQPVGGYDATLRQDKSFVKGRASIADVPLGTDTCTLIEFGGLRISHGFKPLEFAPLKREKTDTDQPGWHITSYEIMEVSVVSVPSNVDAVITAFSREKLHSPLAKAWAKSLKEKLPATVTSGFQAGQPGIITVPLEIDVTVKQHGPGQACTCQDEPPVPAKGRQADPNAGGDSADDDMETDLSKAMQSIKHAGNAMGFMHKGDAAAHWTKGEGDGDDPTHHKPEDIKAMLGACKGVKSVACQKAFPPKDQGWTKLYPKKAAWNNEASDADMNTDGKAAGDASKKALADLLAKHTPEQIAAALEFHDACMKAGRAIAQQHVDSLQTAHDLLGGASQETDPTKMHALGKAARFHVKSVLDVADVSGGKAAEPAHAKAGRVLSKANYAVLKEAHDVMQSAHGVEDANQAKGMYKAAQYGVKSVLDVGCVTGGDTSPRPLVQPDDDGDGDDDDKAAVLVRKLTTRLMDGDYHGCSGRQLKLLEDLLGDALDDLRQRRAMEALALSA